MIDPQTQAMLRNRHNPDGSDLRKLQLRLLDMLKYLDSVCRENDIQYWISSGTALGAIRHGGFIPWDDDADIEMLKPDYKKLISALKRNPHPRYKLQDGSTDVEYTGIVAKLRDSQSTVSEHNAGEENLKYKGVFVDLFCIEPSNTPRLNKLSHKIQLAGLYHVSRIKNKNIRHLLLRFNRLWICNMLFPLLSLFGRIGNRRRLRHVIGSGFTAMRMADEVTPTVYVDFEDTQLPVPEKYDSYLTRMFGDYMQLPPKEDLQTHLKEINI